MELVILNGHQTGLLSETDFFNNISSFPCQGTDTNKTEFVAYIHPWKSMTALHREYVIFAHISMRAAPSSRPRYSELTAPAEWDQLFFCFHCLFHRWFGGLISLQISFISGCVFFSWPFSQKFLTFIQLWIPSVRFCYGLDCLWYKIGV